MRAFLHVLVSRIRAVFRSRELDLDFDEELESHLAMAEEDKIREGMTAAEARRAARIDLGGLAQLREASHAAQGLPWLDTFWLDMKLALRVLRKYWGLTLVAGLAMVIAIGVGTLVFGVFDLAFGRSLPLDDGKRVVAIQTWDEAAHRRRNTSISDLERWRESLVSLEDIGAFQTVEHKLTVADGATEQVSVAEMTASGFRLARVAPLLGRPLLEEDEAAAADPVVVVGYDVWKTRFQRDPTLVGATLRIGDTVHTVVGVMPEGFAFPVNHRFWTPLRADPANDLTDAGPEGVVFGRLRPGTKLRSAQSELSTLGLLAVGEADERLRARVVPYPFAFTGDFERGQVRWIASISLFLVILLLAAPCANIAILIYARTVARRDEFAARYALGASRSRIVGQLFIEVLLLASGAALVAIVFTGVTMRWIHATIDRELRDGVPFWMEVSLSLDTVLFAAGLALLAALIAGLVPALKATGSGMQSGLAAMGNRTGVQLGRTWTTLVVAQVALSLAALPSAIEMGWGTVREGVLGPGFAAEDYLTARLVFDPEMVPSTSAIPIEPDASVERNGRAQRALEDRYGAIQAELVRQLEAEPGLGRATLAASVPGEEPWAAIEIERRPGAGDWGPPSTNKGPSQPTAVPKARELVRFNRVDDAFFDTLEVPLLAGHGFDPAETKAARAEVLVNRTFVEQLFGTENPLGRRVRFADIGARDPGERTVAGPWHEIVGVVDDVPANPHRGTMYLPMSPGDVHPASLTLHVGTLGDDLAGRLQELSSVLGPMLRIEEVRSLQEIYRENQVGNNLGALSLVVVTLSILLLSAAGMYALMSFTFAQRRREIGIRSVLGAQPHRLLAGIFGRAIGQLTLGAVCGAGAAFVLDYYLPIEQAGGWNLPGVIPAACAFMVAIGLMATAGPARRGLRLDPVDELRGG